MNGTEQRYHSNKQEFLTLKWVVTEQFHEYLSPYGKNRNEFVVCTDNNPLTYIFSSANLDAAGQQWVAHLTSYNFSLEYQKGKDNTVANFLSQMNEHLPEEEVQEYLNKIPRLKEAFAVARCLTSEEVAKQCRYYDNKAGAVALQPGDVVMVCTNGFVGKRKVKDRWEDGGFIVKSQLEDWPVYKVKCLTSDDRQKPKYWILHRNCLLLVTNEDVSDIPGQAQAKATPTVSNATLEAFSAGISSLEKL